MTKHRTDTDRVQQDCAMGTLITGIEKALISESIQAEI